MAGMVCGRCRAEITDVSVKEAFDFLEQHVCRPRPPASRRTLIHTDGNPWPSTKHRTLS